MLQLANRKPALRSQRRLGLTLRTPIGLASGVRVLEEGTCGLLPLSSINLAIHRKDATLDPMAERLIDIVTDGVRDLL